MRQFIGHNLSWLAGLHARTETVAATYAGGRAVVELLARLDHNGQELAWPVAVVAESPDDLSVVFRTYCSQWPVDERRHVRPPILKPGPTQPGDVVGRYQAALAAGDVDAVLSTFAPDGYFRGPFGPHYAYRSTPALRAFFTQCFSAGGGIGLEHCAVTDDGVHCALEYNCVRWGSHDLPPQAGISVYERDPEGLLAAVRVYDDIEAPANAPLTGRKRSRPSAPSAVLPGRANEIWWIWGMCGVRGDVSTSRSVRRRGIGPAAGTSPAAGIREID